MLLVYCFVSARLQFQSSTARKPHTEKKTDFVQEINHSQLSDLSYLQSVMKPVQKQNFRGGQEWRLLDSASTEDVWSAAA